MIRSRQSNAVYCNRYLLNNVTLLRYDLDVLHSQLFIFHNISRQFDDASLFPYLLRHFKYLVLCIVPTYSRGKANK
uniref:Uncharacterized protein n=1 Tax=Pararge aegeria TaxID=116150 RepID=S4NMK3_9NEOP